MAQKIDNLRVNNTEVKHVCIKLKKNSDWEELKEFFFNNTLIWKNANAFVFIDKLTEEMKLDLLSRFGEDTIIFEGFSKEFTGSYIMVQDAEQEKPEIIGQMVVETTDGEE